MKTFYDILKIPRNATQKEILDAYRHRCIETHPDKGGSETDFLNIRKGYEILSNPEKRAEYDRWVFQKEKEELEKEIQKLKKEREIYEGSKIRNTDRRYHKSKNLNFIIPLIVIAMFFGLIVYTEKNKQINKTNKVELDKNNSQDNITEKDGKWLYNELSKYSNIGTYNNFIEELKDPVMAKYYYVDAGLKGIDIGTPDEFRILLKREGITNMTYKDEDLKVKRSPSNTIEYVNKVTSKANIINQKIPIVKSNKNYTETTYHTGDIPYSKTYGKGQFDYSSLSQLKVLNYSSKDAVVLLENTYGITIRNVYISNGSQYTLDKIPEGHYRIKVMYGNSWYSEKDNGVNFPKGGFMKNVSYSKSKDNDLFNYIFEESYDGISYPTYSITLHKVRNGNMQTQSITKDDFFNN